MSERSRQRDVVAVESRISAIVDDTLAYRGIPIEALFEHATFDETVFLLWFGQLPAQTDLTAFQQRIAAAPARSAEVRELVARAAPSGVTRALEASMLGVGLHPAPEGDLLALPLSILTALPDIVAQIGRWPAEPADPSLPQGASIAERFLGALRDGPVAAHQARAFDRALILTADHELNASTFAARVAASTGADLVSVVLAALATQSGPLHAGSMLETGALLTEVADHDSVSVIDRRLAAGQRLPGFGHSVYQRGDPRAALFRQLLLESAEQTGDARWLERADQVAQIGTERIGLAPNLDLYAAAFWSTLGIPTALFPAVFAIGRVAGWIAHYREQTEDNRLIRPRARYIGRTGQPYIPIEERGEWFTR